jgi:tetratricopeptide (TPR) repeat protein
MIHEFLKQPHTIGAMEREPISKNRVSPKNDRSRRKITIKKISFIILICCYTVLLHAQQNDVEEMRRHIRYAQTAYNAGEFNDALKEYKTAQTFAPDYPELYKAIGEVYEKLGGSANLTEAINSYQNYLKLAPDANDSRNILDKIYELEYLRTKAETQDNILADITGSWVAINNVEVTNMVSTNNGSNEKVGIASLLMSPNKGMDNKDKNNVTEDDISWNADYVFDITEVIQSGKHTGVYRITIQPTGCRFYRESIIEKTVTVTVTKDNFLNFTFADAQVYTPNPAKYDGYRIFSDMLASSMDKPWIGNLTNSAANAYQAADLPSNTQTAYNFTLNYDEGKLTGMVNIKQNYADPTKQQVTQNKLEEITFVKRDDNFYAKLKNVYDNQPDILTQKPGAMFSYVDKNGMKVSPKGVYTKILSVDFDLAKRYKKVSRREKTCFVVSMIGSGILGGGLAAAIFGYEDMGDEFTMGVLASLSGGLIIGISMPISIHAAKTRIKLVNQYNDQLIQRKNKPVSELRFGITPSGGIGLTMNF